MTKKELANLAGYTFRRLFDIDNNLPEDKKLFVPSDNDGKYDLSMFVQRWAKYNADQVSEEDLSLDEIKALHEKVKMEKTEIEVQRLHGELLDANDVRKAWGNVAATVTQNMLRLAAKIAPQVAGLDNVDLISGIVDAEIRSVLNDIADTPVPETNATAQEDDDGRTDDQ